MPITAEEGLNMVNSKELKNHERQWFEKLCQFTDHNITTRFDGKSFTLSLENPWLKGPNGSNINCGPMCYHPEGGFPWWRQKIVVEVWVSAYEQLGWKITPTQNKNYTYPQEFKFEIDIRDKKIKEILS